MGREPLIIIIRDFQCINMPADFNLFSADKLLFNQERHYKSYNVHTAHKSDFVLWLLVFISLELTVCTIYTVYVCIYIYIYIYIHYNISVSSVSGVSTSFAMVMM